MILNFLRRDPQKPPRRRSLENPNTSLSDPDVWLEEAWGGGRASSGIAVNANTVLTYSPVWRAVNLISNSVAKIPLCTYKRTGTGKDKDQKHPAYKLLRYQPSKSINFFVFKFVLQAQALIQGNGYAWIRRIGGTPVELMILDAARVKVNLDAGLVVYAYTNTYNQEATIAREDMLHIRGFGDSLEGSGVVTKARESFGLGMAAAKYGSVFFKNGARPSAVLEHPARLGEEAERTLRQSWENLHTGDIENKHKIAILEEGMKLNVFQMSNEDAQFLQTRQFEIREVANWFGLPPHKLGDTTRTAFASLEQENQSFLDDSLDPWLVSWEAECMDKLLSPSEKDSDTHVIEFMRQALARANLTDQAAFYASGLQNGYMNRDEVRNRINLNPIPDGEGEKFFVPLNMGLTGEDDQEAPAKPAAPVPAAPQQPSPEPDPQEEYSQNLALVAAHRALVADLVARAVKRLAPIVRKRAKDPGAFVDWVDAGMEAEVRGLLHDPALPVAACLRASGNSTTHDKLVWRFWVAVDAELRVTTEAKAEDLEKRVAVALERLERTAPAAVSGIVR